MAFTSVPFLRPAVAALVVVASAVVVDSGPQPQTYGPAPAQAAALVPNAAGTLQTSRPRRFSDVLLSTYEGDDAYVSLAYNEAAKQYLVVWNMGGDVYGQRLDLYGTGVGDVFPIHYAEHYANCTAVAYSTRENTYLVVWDELGHGYDVRGQLVTADGRLLDNRFTPENESDPAVSFAIAGSSLNQDNEARPHLAFGGQSYFVVWNHWQGLGAQDIAGVLVSDEGQVPSKPVRLSESDGVSRTRPRVAFDDGTNEFLVVYERGATADTGGGVMGRRVHASGVLAGAEYLIAGPDGCRRPDVAHNGRDSYVVVYSRIEGGAFGGVSSRWVRPGADGQVGPRANLSDDPPGPDGPRLWFAGTSGVGLAVWYDRRTAATSGFDVRARRVQADGQPLGEPLAVTTHSSDDSAAAVGASSTPPGFLVAWKREVAAASDLYGQRISTLGTVMGAEFGLSARPGAQHQPSVAYNLDDQQFLAVWADDGDRAIWGLRLDARGWPVEVPWVIDSDGYNGDPSALYHDGRGHYVVVWSDDERDAMELALVGRGGVATAKTTVGHGMGSFPRLAWEAPADRVLVVWQATGDILAAALNGDGTPTRGGYCHIATGGTEQTRPEVVYDSRGKQFLVVWEERAGGAHDLYGRFVGRGCELRSEPLCLAGCSDEADYFAPALSFDPNLGEFLLSYARSDTPATVALRAQRLDAAGRPTGAEIAVATEPTERHSERLMQARVVYSAAARSHFVVWPQWGVDGARMDLYTRWLGLPSGASTPMRLFAHDPGDQYAPVAALETDGDGVLVAWTDGRRAGGLDVYARHVALDVTPPVARLAIDPPAGVAGTTFTLSAEGSTDDTTPSSLLKARWDYTSDGQWDTAWSLTKTVTRTVNTPGWYTVTVQVADLGALTDAARRTFRVVTATGNRPPTAHLTVSPPRGPAGTRFQLDASASSDAETPVASLEVRWDFEADGEFDSDWSVAKTTEWTLTAAGGHGVRLLVRDAGGLTATSTGEVIVEPGDLVRLAISPAAALVRPREVVRFTAQGADAFENPVGHANVIWSLADASVGQIDERGVFTAGLRTGVFRDVVRGRSGAAQAAASLAFTWPQRVCLPWAFRH